MSEIGREVQFKLHMLGWKAFQDLCAMILREVWGQTFQVFAPGNDGGRDGAFRGTWACQKAEAFSGSFTVQCKHTAEPSKSLALSDVKDELEKVTALAEAGFADTYVLLTNHSLKGTAETEVVREIVKAGAGQAACFGSEWIAQVIVESPRLRLMVPRVYGLGDLTEILDDRAYAQAEQVFHSAADELARFVPTTAYREAANALEAHHFVCLLGEPGSGKSSIAAALALHSADAWKTRTMRVRQPSDFADRWNPRDPNQFFWVDDAVGALQYQRDYAQLWNQLFPEMAAAIRGGARMVWTSRDYIFQRAATDLKTSHFPLLKDSRVVIEVDKLSEQEKQELLYNHIKLGDQPMSFKSRLKPSLDGLSKMPKLLPEIVRRLGLMAFTRQLTPTESGLEQFVANPTDYLLEVLEGLSASERAALAVLFGRGGRSDVGRSFSDEDRALVEGMGGTPQDAQVALRTLAGSLVSIERSEACRQWVFRHPSIADSVAEYLIRDPALVRLYVDKTPLTQLLREVTCGDVGLANVRLVLRRDAYEAVVERIQVALNGTDRWDMSSPRRAALSFLSYRCDTEFLRLFRERTPNFLDSVRFGSYLSAVVEVDVVVALHQRGLLSEAERQDYVAGATHLAASTPDGGILELEGLRGMFTSDETAAAMTKVRAEVVEDLKQVVQDESDNYSSPDDPESHFTSLRGTLGAFERWFLEVGDMRAVSMLRKGAELIDASVDSLRSGYVEPPISDSRVEASLEPEEVLGSRSRFDDVDQ